MSSSCVCVLQHSSTFGHIVADATLEVHSHARFSNGAIRYQQILEHSSTFGRIVAHGALEVPSYARFSYGALRYPQILQHSPTSSCKFVHETLKVCYFVCFHMRLNFWMNSSDNHTFLIVRGLDMSTRKLPISKHIDLRVFSTQYQSQNSSSSTWASSWGEKPQKSCVHRTCAH